MRERGHISNRTQGEEMLEKIISIGETILNFIDKLPLTDILVGVVVPIMAAWISYYLAERAIRKKENNRLYIQVELIRKELKANDETLNKYIASVDEMNKMEKALEFPLIFMKQFLISILDRLQEIKSNYMHSGQFIFEKPTKVYLLAQKLEDIEKAIDEKECQYYSDEYLDEKRKEQISKLTEEKEQYLKEIKAIKDVDIYKDFLALQMQLEKLMVGDVFGKIEEKGDNFVLAKYLYDRIKSFNEKTDKVKEDVLALYKDLVIFEIDSDIVKDGCFDQETFDLYYKTFENPEGIQAQLYELCEKYYKWLALKEQIANYEFNFIDKRWQENCADFVIINDRDLYVSLVELYESLTDDKGNSYEEKYKYCVMCHDEIQGIIKKLDQHELKIKKKCK